MLSLFQVNSRDNKLLFEVFDENRVVSKTVYYDFSHIILKYERLGLF